MRRVPPLRSRSCSLTPRSNEGWSEERARGGWSMSGASNPISGCALGRGAAAPGLGFSGAGRREDVPGRGGANGFSMCCSGDLLVRVQQQTLCRELLLCGRPWASQAPKQEAPQSLDLRGFLMVQRNALRYYSVVPRRGLEPPRLSALVPETSASTNSAIWAFVALTLCLLTGRGAVLALA